jgi:hypothetical protein
MAALWISSQTPKSSQAQPFGYFGSRREPYALLGFAVAPGCALDFKPDAK